MYFLNHQAFTTNTVLFKGTELEPSYSVDLILSEFVLKKKTCKKTSVNHCYSNRAVSLKDCHMQSRYWIPGLVIYILYAQMWWVLYELW